jgi:hypothetical protein
MNLSRGLIAVSLFGLLAGLCGGGRSSTQRTFTSGDGAFRFKYSYGLVACKQEAPKNAGEPGEWSCGACNDRDSSWKTTACLEFPKGHLRFNSDSFYGRFVLEEPKEEVTEQSCLDAKKGGEKQAKDKVIHGVKFKVFYPDQVSPSDNEEREIYRTYHRNNCYSLTIWKQWTGTNTWDPETFKKSRKEGERVLEDLLADPVKTFEFLK